MNIAFLTPGFLQRMGGGTTYVSHTNYLILAHDGKTKQQKTQKKPQMKAPRVTSLQSRASGGRIHVCPHRAYVGTKSRSVAFGAGVSTYALRGIGVRGVENPQGFGIDERRSIASPHY